MGALTITGLTILGSYLLGATPFGYLIARRQGIDIRRQGSGNIGATNVGRVLGRKYGVLVFVLDFAKGALPVAAAVWITRRTAGDTRLFLEQMPLTIAAGLAAFLGHMFPVYLRFRGGKGVATGAGAVAVLLPVPAALAFLTWIVLVCATRYVSLASMAAALGLSIFHMVLMPDPWTGTGRVLTAFCFLAAALVFVRHRANLTRLVRGTESHLGDTPAMLALTKVIHLLALGTWLGTVVFFTFVAGLGVFHAFQAVAEQDGDSRPGWLPLPGRYDRNPNEWGAQGTGPFTDRAAVRREQGNRAAGLAVSAMFRGYYPLQIGCGLLAVATAFGWWRSTRTAGFARIRVALLILSVLSVLTGWALEQTVARLQQTRNAAVDVVLASPRPAATDVDTASAAVQQFGRWHAASLLVNFVTLILVAVATAMAVRLPVPITVGGAAPPKDPFERPAAAE